MKFFKMNVWHRVVAKQKCKLGKETNSNRGKGRQYRYDCMKHLQMVGIICCCLLLSLAVLSFIASLVEMVLACLPFGTRRNRGVAPELPKDVHFDLFRKKERWNAGGTIYLTVEHVWLHTHAAECLSRVGTSLLCIRLLVLSLLPSF